MNFITFSTSSTTIFPLANSTTGSQLLSEYNLRVRDSVATNPDITYMSCPSYTHSLDDFYVRIQEDDSGAITDSYVLEILPGKAMINGHFVQNSDSMTVDLIAANNELASMSLNPLSGNLAIGIRAYYSTEESMSGGITEEGEIALYQGVQLVVLPEKELITPDQSPDDKNKVTCHLKLASFDFINDVISNVKQNNDKIQYINSDRIGNIDDMIASSYVSSNGLNAKKLYTYSGRGTSIHDTWCDSTGSLMVWDNAPVKTTQKPSETEAAFTVDSETEAVELVVPHQQIDGMKNSVGNSEYYATKSYRLPLADYAKNTPGTVNGTYAKNIKEVENKFNNFYRLPGNQKKQVSFEYLGKQLQYIPIYDPAGSTDGETFATLPPINPKWNIGDYLLVKEDRSFTEYEGTAIQYPSSYYAVIPGKIINYAFYGTSNIDGDIPTTTNIVPLKPYTLDGVELARIQWSEDSAPLTMVTVNDEPVTQGVGHGYIQPDDDGNYVKLRFPDVDQALTMFPQPKLDKNGNIEISDTGEIVYDYVPYPDSSVAPFNVKLKNIDSTTGSFKNLQSSGVVAQLLQDDINILESYKNSINTVISKIQSDSSNVTTNMNNTISSLKTGGSSLQTLITDMWRFVNDVWTSFGSTMDMADFSAGAARNIQLNTSPGSAPYNSALNIFNYTDFIRETSKSERSKQPEKLELLRNAQSNLNSAVQLCQTGTIQQINDIQKMVNQATQSISSLLQPYINSITSDYASDMSRIINMTASYTYSANNSEDIIADYNKYNGYAHHDYFTVVHTNKNGTTTYYYYMVTESQTNTWSTPSLISPPLPLAGVDTIGGFKGIDTSDLQYTDGGYVTVNDDGNLQLVDYALLRAGVAAYQLGQDLTYESGTTVAEIQTFLDEYVNDRITFPNTEQLMKSNTPNVINIYITLPSNPEDASTPLLIKNIDSRFNCAVFFHFSSPAEETNAESNITINIMDCQKLRIDSDISGKPIINVYRTCLYYDSEVFNYIIQCGRSDYTFTGMEDISLWYEMFESTDPDLVVNDMTVTQVNTPIITEDIDYWNTTTPNDNHYITALKSITFASDGTIMGFDLLLANQSTDNVRTGQKLLVGQFELPQGRGLTYPKACLVKQMKITGTFSSCYYTSGYWAVSTTNFSALTQSYSIVDMTQTGVGSIAFNTETNLVEADLGETIEQGGIPPFESDSYHIFSGGIIS